MWPFKSAAATTGQPLIDGPWSILRGKYDRTDTIVRLNTGYRKFGSLPGYGHQVGIAVPFRSPGKTWQLSQEEHTELHAIEEEIRRTLQHQTGSPLVAVITTQVMREFVLHTRVPEKVARLFKELSKRITTHRIQLLIQPDQDWKVYALLGETETTH